MKSHEPIVSVICICYNHATYVTATLESVLNQTYGNFELIIVDDASRDNSAEVISNFISNHSHVRFISLKTNSGICKAFNTGFRECRGEFIIDLAADDLLEPDRLENGVNLFKTLDDTYGVIFGDAEWVDKNQQHLYFHSERFPHTSVPQGDIYQQLIEKYFICSPTMMFRRSVMESLNGYDESLTYEDFDFWIRSSREFRYAYDPRILVKKRKLSTSLSATQHKIRNRHNPSTFRVCEKILTLNKTTEEHKSLRRRIHYETRQCLRTLDFTTAMKYGRLLARVNSAIRSMA